MKRLKRSAFFLEVLILAISMVSCTKVKEPTETGNMDTIRLAMIPYMSNTVFQIGIEEGFFEEQGINIELVSVKSAREFIPLTLSGDIDISAPGLSAALFNGISKGGEMKVILPLSQFKATDCPYIAYLARKEDVDAKIYENKADWVNGSVVISNQGITGIPGFILSKVLTGSGITIDEMDIKIVEIPAYEDALVSEQVDIVYAIEPSVTRLLANEEIALLEPGDPYVDGLVASVVLAGSKIYENEDLANRFSIAYLKAVQQYLEGPTERNIEHVVQLTGLDIELVKDICWSYVPPDGRLDTDSIDAYQNFLMERGLLNEFVEIDEYYDSSFTEYAIQHLDGE